MSCVVSLIGLGLNFDLISVPMFIVSQVIGVIVLLLYAGYFLFHVRVVREIQLYKINIAVLLILIPFMNKLFYPCVFFLNLIEVVFFILDFCYYRQEKLNILNYVFQRIFILFCYNVAILVESQVAILVCLAAFVSTLVAMKSVLYYQTYKLEYRPEIVPEDVKEFSIKEEVAEKSEIAEPVPEPGPQLIDGDQSAAQIINLDEAVREPEIVEEPPA